MDIGYAEDAFSSAYDTSTSFSKCLCAGYRRVRNSLFKLVVLFCFVRGVSSIFIESSEGWSKVGKDSGSVKISHAPLMLSGKDDGPNR